MKDGSSRYVGVSLLGMLFGTQQQPYFEKNPCKTHTHTLPRTVLCTPGGRNKPSPRVIKLMC